MVIYHVLRYIGGGLRSAGDPSSFFIPQVCGVVLLTKINPIPLIIFPGSRFFAEQYPQKDARLPVSKKGWE